MLVRAPFPKPQILFFFCNTRLNLFSVVERGRLGLRKSHFIEKRGISSVFSPILILDKRAPVLSFAEVGQERIHEFCPLRC